jgi:serine/threonine protein phosphatase PrpC
LGEPNLHPRIIATTARIAVGFYIVEALQMRKSNSDFKASFVSEPGTFITNKGYFAFVELDDIACWIGADGLDSDEEKESAKLVIHRIFEEFIEKPSLSRVKIKKCIMSAHTLLQAESRSVRLKAGFIMLVTDYSKIRWAMAGNLRLYHFRKGIFNFRSKDQSIAQLLVDSGKISEMDLNEHDERHNLVNYIGKSSGFKPFVSRKYRLREGDVMVLCNSGFWENMTTEELSVAVRDSKEAEELVDNLEDNLLGKQNEVLNNYTIAAIYANKVFQEHTINYRQIAKRIVMIVLPLLLIVGIGLLINRQMVAVRQRKEAKTRQKIILTQKKSIAAHERNGDQMVAGEKYQEAVAEYKESLNMIDNNDLKLPQIESTLKKKYDTTLLIVDGDNFTAAGEYSKALAKYNEAIATAAGIVYNKTGITSRLTKLQNLMEMKKLIQEGDNLAMQKKYTDAKGKYQLASNFALQLGDDTTKATLDAKLINLEQRRQEDQIQQTQLTRQQRLDNERNAQIYQAKRLEKTGDERCAQKQWDAAVEAYKMARKIYESLGLSQEILMLDPKIEKAHKKSRSFLDKVLGRKKKVS